MIEIHQGFLNHVKQAVEFLDVWRMQPGEGRECSEADIHAMAALEQLDLAVELLDADASKGLYLLQNCGQGCVGNSPVFWGKTGGYTMWIDDARRWTKEEAEQKIRETRGSHSWHIWSFEEIEACAKRTVDMQDLVRLAASC